MFDNYKSTDGDERITWKTIKKIFYNWITQIMILDVGYWWLIMYKNVHDYYRSCDACQIIGGLTIQSLAKLVTNLPKEPFTKWGFDFVGPIKPTWRYTRFFFSCSHILCYQVGGSKNIES